MKRRCVKSQRNTADKAKKTELNMLIADVKKLANQHEKFESSEAFIVKNAVSNLAKLYTFSYAYLNDTKMNFLVLSKLKSEKIKTYSNDKIYNYILRLLFSKTKRTTCHRYTKVIDAAFENKIEPAYFEEWVDEVGGINNVIKLNKIEVRKPNYAAIAERRFKDEVNEAKFEWEDLTQGLSGRKAVVLIDIDGEHNAKVLAASTDKELTRRMIVQCGKYYYEQEKTIMQRKSLFNVRKQLAADLITLDVRQ